MSIELLQEVKILEVPDVPDRPREEASEFCNNSIPKVRLPGDDYVLSETATELGALLKEKDIFRRGSLVFHPPKTEQEFQPMTAETFRSWTEQHLLFFKVRMTGFGQCIRVIRTMSTSDADGILASPQFLASLREVERFNPVRMPVRKGVCRLHLLAPSLAGLPETMIEQRLKDAETEILDPIRNFPDRCAQWDRLAEDGAMGRGIE